MKKGTKRIFLDYAAGMDNPDAIYMEGVRAKSRLDSARARVAKVLACATDEIVFSGAMVGLPPARSFAQGPQSTLIGQSHLRPHAITTTMEHASVLSEFRRLEEGGVEVTYLAPDSDGLISAKQVGEALRPNTYLVSIMYANNEIGTIQPIREISRLIRRRVSGFAPSDVSFGKHGQSLQSRHSTPTQLQSPIFHSDCVQAPGLLPINMYSLGVDIATFSAPKFGGPRGASFTFIRRGSTGRPGGLLAAWPPKESISIEYAEQMADKLERAEKLREKEVARLTKLRDYFIEQILSRSPGARLNGSQENRLANNVNVVTSIDGEFMVLSLDRAGIAASTGAACSSSECEEGSHVIIAIGKSKDEASRSVRFTLGGASAKSDIDYVIKQIESIIIKQTNLWQKK